MPSDTPSRTGAEFGRGDERVDVVIVGARAAGAATAMLLARRGLKVLAIDRAEYGSDTLSTHALMRGAVVALDRWGVLDRVKQAATPPIEYNDLRYGDRELTLEVATAGRTPLYAPRRTVIDPILVDAARAAGAEVRFGVRFEAVITDRTGRVCGIRVRDEHDRTASIRADLVIGADGLRSSVGRAVDAPITRQGSGRASSILRYWADVDVDHDRYHWLWGDQIGGGIIPTNDGVVAVFVGMPPARFAAEARGDIENTYARILTALDPSRAASVTAATPAGPYRSFPGVAGRFVRPHGPGWALVGDAGYFKDPAAAHGMADAFRDAELLADAVVTGDFVGYERTRDRASRAVFDALEKVVSFEWDLDTLPGLHLDLSHAMRDELTVGTLAA